MQPFQLFSSISSSGCATMAEAGVQLSGTSSAATCSNTGLDSLAALANSLAVVQLELTALQPCSFYKKPLQPCSHAAPINSLTAVQPKQQPCICIRL